MLSIHNRTMRFSPTSKDASGFFVACYHTIYTGNNQKCYTKDFQEKRIIYIPTISEMEFTIKEFQKFLGDITINQINAEIGQEFGNMEVSILLEETIRDCYNYFEGTPQEKIRQSFDLWNNDIPVMQITLHSVWIDNNAPSFGALFDSIKFTISTS